MVGWGGEDHRLVCVAAMSKDFQSAASSYRFTYIYMIISDIAKFSFDIRLVLNRKCVEHIFRVSDISQRLRRSWVLCDFVALHWLNFSSIDNYFPTYCSVVFGERLA